MSWQSAFARYLRGVAGVHGTFRSTICCRDTSAIVMVIVSRRFSASSAVSNAPLAFQGALALQHACALAAHRALRRLHWLEARKHILNERFGPRDILGHDEVDERGIELGTDISGRLRQCVLAEGRHRPEAATRISN